MARKANYLPSRGLRLLPYQDELVRQTMEIEGLGRSGAIRFLLSLGAHAAQQEDRLSEKLDKVLAGLEVLQRCADNDHDALNKIDGRLDFLQQGVTRLVEDL
jgi:hypothetical protein